MRKRPSGVFFLVLLNGLIWALLLLFLGSAVLRLAGNLPSHTSPGEGLVLWGSILIIGGISSFIIAFGLWRMKNWARWSAIIFYGMIMIWAVSTGVWPIAILGILFSSFVMYYLYSIVDESVWEQEFGEKSRDEEKKTFLGSFANWKKRLEDGIIILGIGSGFILSPLVDPLLLIPLLFGLAIGLLAYNVMNSWMHTNKRLGLIFYVISFSSLVFLLSLGPNAETSFGPTITLLSLFTTPPIPFFLLVGRALRGGF